jgi:hypothetical protein
VVGCLRFGEGGRRLFSASFDRTCRLWSLPDGACLQTVKVGTPVLQLELAAVGSDGVDRSSAGGEQQQQQPTDQRALIGCGDGTVRVWDPSARKASKALSTLRVAHKEYVGEVRVSCDGATLLTCSRDGGLLLWRRDPRHGFMPYPEGMPSASLADYWRVDLLPDALVGITERGGVHLWRYGASTAVTLAKESLGSPLSEQPAASLSWATLPGGADAPSEAAVVTFAGARRAVAATADNGGSFQLELHAARFSLPLSPANAAEGGGRAPTVGAAAAAAATPDGRDQPVDAAAGGARSDDAVPKEWSRWRAVATEEGVHIDTALQQRLCTMERVAANAGRGLEEKTVRAFLRRAAAAT